MRFLRRSHDITVHVLSPELTGGTTEYRPVCSLCGGVRDPLLIGAGEWYGTLHSAYRAANMHLAWYGDRGQVSLAAATPPGAL